LNMINDIENLDQCELLNLDISDILYDMKW
jgi:hypothetical protein